MEDLVRRKDAIDEINKYGSIWVTYLESDSKEEIAQKVLRGAKNRVLKILSDLPSVQPEQKHGHWIVTDIPNLTSTAQDVVTFTRRCRCSECGAMFGRESDKYCYNCGARMEESE